MRPQATLFVLAGMLCAADFVRAENWYKRVTPKQTADEMYSFTINAEPITRIPEFEGQDSAGQFQEFHIAVNPKVPRKKLPQDLRHSGQLRIDNGKDFIASSNVQMTHGDGAWLFSFRVAARYAERSGFMFAATDAEGQGAHYWLYLKDFVPPAGSASSVPGDEPKPPKQDAAVASVDTAQPKNLAGNWRMLMTAGFDHQATIKAVGENRYRLDSGATRFNGIYELSDGRLVAIEPKPTAAEGYVWQMHSLYMLTLVEQSGKPEQNYRGAVLFRAKATAIPQTANRQEARLSDAELNRLLSSSKTRDRIKIEHRGGFHTMRLNGSLGEFWDTVKEEHKMRGLVSDRLTREQIDTCWLLEVNISIVADFGDSKYPTLQDELLPFIAEGNRFITGALPTHRDPPPKYLVALFRTTKGEYGLITRYPEFCLIELGGYFGVAPVAPDAKASK